MAARTKRTRSATNEPAPKTDRATSVYKTQNTAPPHIESPTASYEARVMFEQPTVRAAHARSYTVQEKPYAPPYRTGTPHLFQDIEIPHKKHDSRRNLFTRFVPLSWRLYLALFICLAIAGISFYVLTRPKNTPTEIMESIRALVIGVGDEVPAIYSVTDSDEIAQQGGQFKRLIVGDVILSYSKAELVVFYRSSEEKIIAVFSISGGK